MKFSITDTTPTSWVQVFGPTVVKRAGTWTGSVLLESRQVGDDDTISPVGDAFTDNDSETLNHPRNVTLEYRFRATSMSGTFIGTIGG